MAHYGGSCVRRWDPNSGKVLDQTIAVQQHHSPAPLATISTLYTAQRCPGNERRSAGKDAVGGQPFRANPGVKGAPTFVFAG